MKRFIEGEERSQATLFPEQLDRYIAEDNPVRVIDVFVDELDMGKMGFKTVPAETGRPSYHPSTMLKLYIYGYLNRIQSSRRLEREAGRNVELMWLLGRLAPDFKTIADFRKDNTKAIRLVCREFVLLCRKLDLFSDAFGGEQATYRFSSEDKGKIMRRYWSSSCVGCSLKPQCTTGKYRRISRWEHEAVLEDVNARLESERGL